MKLFGQNNLISLRRRVGGFLIETGMSVLKIKDPTVPPPTMDFVGGFDFKAIGFEFLRYFIEFGGLKPDHTVLDIGSGIGRMAIPMANYLKKGHYEGIDIVPMGIDWCQKNITSRYPNFRFQLSDIYNKAYNYKGKLKASEYRFPFEDETFDFVFLTSVFTHMLTEDVIHYVKEIYRVLKKPGRCLSTWFLLNDETKKLLEENTEALQIKYPVPGHEQVFTGNPVTPEDATGYPEQFVDSLLQEAGFTVEDPVRYGSWCGRKDYTTYQDMVVCCKK